MKTNKLNSKAKGPVRLRMKNLTHGNKSLYLDIYWNGHRSYCFLKLYIIPEHTAEDRALNRRVMSLAEMQRAQKTYELLSEHLVGCSNNVSGNVKLVDWMHDFSQLKLHKGQSEEFSRQILKATKHIMKYSGKDLLLKDVDKNFCLGFISYLKASSLSAFTISDYFRCFNCALNLAVREGVLSHNPIALIPNEERLQQAESRREYLTIPELKRLVRSDCKKEMVKRAYLFSCMCGLRLSDIKKLRWCDLYCDGSQWRASIMMKKTHRLLYIPISAQAILWLPQRSPQRDDTAPIFELPTDSYTDLLLREWALENSIKKRITFHTARHTFATMMLTLGSDIYTVSKLLGHSQVRTTQIYAKIVDKKKDEAVGLIPDMRGL